MAQKILDVAHGWLDSRGSNLAGVLDYCSCCHAMGRLQILLKVIWLWCVSNLILRGSWARASLKCSHTVHVTNYCSRKPAKLL